MSAYQFQPDPTDVITKRYVAAVIDVAMEWIVWIIAFVIAFAVFSHDVIRYDNNGFGTYRAYKSTELTGAGWVFVIVIGLAYMVSVFVIWRGQTGRSPGTLMLGLVTVNEQGAPLGVGRALLRSVAGIVDYIGICSVPIVGIATSASSKGHRRVGDMAAKSLVVDKQYAGQPLYVPALNLATAAGPYGQAYGQPYGAYPGQPYAQPYGQPGQPVGQPFAQPGQAAPPFGQPGQPAQPFGQPGHPGPGGQGGWGAPGASGAAAGWGAPGAPAATPDTPTPEPGWGAPGATGEQTGWGTPGAEGGATGWGAPGATPSRDTGWAAPTTPQADESPAAAPATPPATEATEAAAPAPATPPATEAAAPAPDPTQPQWDAQRGAYIQWDPAGQRWLQYDDAAKQWRSIS